MILLRIFFQYFISETLKQCSHLKSIFNQLLLTNIIKNTEWGCLDERPKYLLKKGGKAQALEIELQNCFIKTRECFVRANIFNQSKSLHFSTTL
jgi:hypothetical protein